MGLSTCTKCGGHIPLGPDATNRCETCGAGVFDDQGPAERERDTWEQHAKHNEAVIATLRAERDKLAEFKAFVHKRLDDAGVPADPPGPHRDAGCRIGQRLDWLLAREAALVDRIDDLGYEMAELAERMSGDG